MKKSLAFMISSIIVIILLLMLFFTWFLPEKMDSFAEPTEALFAIDRELLLIPAYQLDNESLYFFIKNEKNVGVSYLQKSFLGWKAGMLTWSTMDTSFEDGMLSGAQGHGDKLVYGLFKNEGEHFVEVNGERAKMLNLAMLGEEMLHEYNLEDMFLWYFESDTVLEEIDIKLFDKNTQELLDTF